ncbi:hypothetical protein MAPG_06402 [Magnaporthiopsis poae ATCC 64411]|uniref:DUF7907 domain-containing protein n=1 Tax=Magnaporthiopsis poae (strain ATCC 64411 / 73-15) TaxID=644358 RepID=A0A0C4E1X8_MAGP6|nr:hypothetical protein MAPG_06402 [Magnaporthiopsis poae ATCC 64411]
MKAQSLVSAVVALAGTSAFAQPLTGGPPGAATNPPANKVFTKSGPFNLIVSESSNSTVVGWLLGACHAGAGTEGLCVYNDGPSPPSSTFSHNTSDDSEPVSGPLVWELPTKLNGMPTTLPSSMSLSYTAWSDIAVPLFRPGYSKTPIGFDEEDKMFLVAYGDDGVHDPQDQLKAIRVEEARKMYNWYVCWTYIGSYYYHALTWSTSHPPQNPTCNAANVTRKFLESSSDPKESDESSLRAKPEPLEDNDLVEPSEAVVEPEDVVVDAAKATEAGEDKTTEAAEEN